MDLLIALYCSFLECVRELRVAKGNESISLGWIRTEGDLGMWVSTTSSGPMISSYHGAEFLVFLIPLQDYFLLFALFRYLSTSCSSQGTGLLSTLLTRHLCHIEGEQAQKDSITRAGGNGEHKDDSEHWTSVAQYERHKAQLRRKMGDLSNPKCKVSAIL